MDAHTADRPNYLLGALLNEAKTKKIYLAKGSTDRVTVVASRRRRKARHHPRQGPARHRDHIQCLPPAQSLRLAGGLHRARQRDFVFRPEMRDAAL